ncbi:MAG: hypothetical protein RTU30_02595 [Candidatus Thorarchaeota archaeon]
MKLDDLKVTHSAIIAIVTGLVMVVLSPSQSVLVDTHGYDGYYTWDSYYLDLTGMFVLLILGVVLTLGGVVVLMLQGARSENEIVAVLTFVITFSWMVQVLLVSRGILGAGQDFNMYLLTGFVSILLICAVVYSKPHRVLSSLRST